ncbi:TetR/AcrR family transcriptional regulator [Labrys monachus]|uniref:TetR/AcrR family transcriptional repressor of nem operon n=1 Tax=Labrys monachus TaxID=217067 RepID=A0ABU0F6R1_9HYPH|nr:TetR/AcrR family transcriptional regulator [Labrys monachus]MDQ0390308.1 TetR/AcrR family transcriptional repressor of nem operon [Labrys monachus]
MRVSREQAARNKERVVAVAARLFGERGFDGVGIEDVMAGAGLTRGGFYKSFPSKDGLVETACRHAVERSGRTWDRLLARTDDPLGTLLESYLSAAHRDDPAAGCPYAALGSEARRRQPSVRQAFGRGIAAAIGKLAAIMPADAEGQRRERALAALAGMVGALVLARAVDDPALSDEILASTRRALGAAGRGESPADIPARAAR